MKASSFSFLIPSIVLGILLTAQGCAGPEPRPPEGRRGPPPFSLLDQNQDGYLYLDEFRQHPIPQGTHEQIFRELDADGDGVVTREEYESHRPPGPPPA